MPRSRRRLHHCPHAVLAPDVTGINAQTIDAKLGHTQRDLVVEMNVGHERYADLLFDFSKGLGRLHGRHGHAHDVGAGLDQTPDLRHRRRHVSSLGVGHALDADGRTVADGHLTHLESAALASRDRTLAEFHCAVCSVPLPTVRRAIGPRWWRLISTGRPLYSTRTPLALPRYTLNGGVPPSRITRPAEIVV